MCICYDSETGLAATGALGANPEICVWAVDKMKPVAKFYQGKGTKAVSIIRFIGSRQVLTVSVESDSSSISVWNLEGKRTTVKCPGVVYNVSTCQQHFAVASSKGAYIGKYVDRDDLTLQCLESGQFSATAFRGDSAVFGKPNGELLFKGETYSAHKGCIYAITCRDGLIYSSGSEDRLLRVFKGMKEVRSIQLEEYARSIDVFEGKVLLGLRNGKIVEVGEDDSISIIMDCHYMGETFGLCYDKQTRTVLTAGEDNKIIRFSL